MTRLLFLTDAHIGSGKEYGREQGDRLRDQEKVLGRAFSLAVELDCDAIVNGGDTFHGPKVETEEYAAFQRPLRRLRELNADIPVITLLGNGKHDSSRREVTAPEVVSAESEIYTRTGIRRVGDVTLALIPAVPIDRLVAAEDGGDREQIQAQAVEMLLSIARGLHDDCGPGMKVLVLHGMVSGASVPTGITTDQLGTYVLPVEELAALGFDAVLCGDIHKPQILHGGIPDVSGPILYGGSLALVDFGEEHVEHGVWIIDLNEGEPIEIHFMAIPDRTFMTIDVDLTQDSSDGRADSPMAERGLARLHADGVSDDQPPGMTARTPGAPALDPTDVILTAIGGTQLSLVDAVVRLRYRASEEQQQRIDLPAIRAHLADAGIHKLMPVQADIVRATRARVEGVTETLPPLDALGLWMEAESLAGWEQESLRLLTASYLQAVGA